MCRNFATLWKYALASLSAFFIDYSIYCLLVYALGFLEMKPKIWISVAVARVVSSFYNYAINKSVVFRNQERRKKAFFKYYALCAIQLCCSASLVYALCRYMRFPETMVKPAVDTVLFAAGFQIQKNWVFRKG